MSNEFEIQGLELRVQELTEELETVQASHWADIQALNAKCMDVVRLEDEVRDLEREVDWLRDRLSEKPYS